MDKLYKSDKNEVEKDLLSNQYKRLYKIGKYQYLIYQNLSNKSDIKNSKVYSYSSSYSSNTNSDGSTTIIERKTELNNGNKKQTINAYKKMPNGETIPLTKEEIKQLEKPINYQIDN